MTQVQLVNSFLSFLGTTKQPTSLKFLNELIKAHQEKVKEPIHLSNMKELISRSNDWHTSPVLKKIQIFGYIDGILTSINDNVLKRYFQGKKREQIITSSELNYWITERFCVDKEIYERAIEIFNEKSSNRILQTSSLISLG
ncbi:hypothetical protein COK67_21620 [Bacillus cereus]|uniref:hypothetical protein n=1 Tax=Bacillus cereus TaxID=1396 RepID=UPI000BFA1E5B|nr:hypothetical protein [Bacillus cereus]PFT61692.1 hypothetical protein COK67_21620 [Bacillus cereus]